MKEAVVEWKRQRREVFVPLTYRPGDLAQVDFFEVLVDVAGVRRKAFLFLMRLMYSGRDFACIYERQDQVSFLDGHVRAFAPFGGVPARARCAPPGGKHYYDTVDLRVAPGESVSSPIDSPLTISFAGMPVAPLRFFLQRDYAPAGIVHEVDKGITATLTPAHTEWGLRMTGDDLTAVLYQFPRSDDVDLVCACLNDAVTPLFRVLTGPDYGEALTTLIADQWPDLHGLLAHSSANVPGTRKLCRVITNESTQWIVADDVSGAQRSAITVANATSLIGTALDTFHKATHPAELRGVIEVFSEPDRRSRRLNAIAGLLKAPQNILEQFEDGLNSLNLFELVQVVGECIEHVKEFRR